MNAAVSVNRQTTADDSVSTGRLIFKFDHPDGTLVLSDRKADTGQESARNLAARINSAMSKITVRDIDVSAGTHAAGKDIISIVTKYFRNSFKYSLLQPLQSTQGTRIIHGVAVSLVAFTMSS